MSSTMVQASIFVSPFRPKLSVRVLIVLAVLDPMEEKSIVAIPVPRHLPQKDRLAFTGVKNVKVAEKHHHSVVLIFLVRSGLRR